MDFNGFQWWFLQGNHNHQANPHVHQQHIVSETSLLTQYVAGERVDLLEDFSGIFC